MINSVVRQLAVLVPCAYLLGAATGSVSSVWWAFLIAEVFSVVLTTVFFVRVYRKVIKPL